MDRSVTKWLVTAALLIASVATSRADIICESEAEPDSIAEVANADGHVVTRVIFITFPDAPQTSLPTWADSLATEFEDYIATMSRGAQAIDASVVRRPGLSTQAWVAPQSSSYYRGLGGLGYGLANAAIMQQIADSLGSSCWSGVEHVIAIHYRGTFSNTDYAGISSLGCTGSGCQASFTGGGTTQRLQNDYLQEDDARTHAKWIAAHEYGHRLGLAHSKGSEAPALGGYSINMGRYDVMNALASFAGYAGFAPYHVVHLLGDQAASLPRWLPSRTLITTNLKNLHVPDVRVTCSPTLAQS